MQRFFLRYRSILASILSYAVLTAAAGFLFHLHKQHQSDLFYGMSLLAASQSLRAYKRIRAWFEDVITSTCAPPRRLYYSHHD